MSNIQEDVEKVTVQTQKLFEYVNEERRKTKQRIFERQTMAIIMNMSFIALSKEWVDFKRDLVDIPQCHLDVLVTVCREKFNIELTVEPNMPAPWL